MDERFCDVGRGITLCYEPFGTPGDEPVLLIMGLGTQMVAWHEDFCRDLAARGYYVVRFGNRDIGRPTGLPRDPDEIRALAGISYERDHDIAGPGRQLAAIIASGDRTRELRKVVAPTLVVHGAADPLVSPSGGRATARAIRGAKLMT